MFRAWDAASIDRLTKLWTETDLSASEIAVAMGGFEHCRDGGRNAICGKVMRLGLPQRRLKKTPEELEAERIARDERSKQRRTARFEARPYVRKEQPLAKTISSMAEVEMFTAEQLERAIPFADLRSFSGRQSNQCRFILNHDPSNYLYCGAVTPPGESWCPHCREIVMRDPGPVLSDDERFRRAVAFKKNALPRTVTDMPTAKDQAA